MGEVYRAHDEKLGREVAIKVLPTALAADRERLARFEREAKVLASLNHPNIAAIYEIAESNGVPALVLELIEGDTLEDRLAVSSRSGSGGGRGTSRSAVDGATSGVPPDPSRSQRPESRGLAVGEALRVARQIAEALEAAHERGVVHRDLKPANIKLTASGSVKLLDFGLAKAREVSEQIDLTHSPTKALNMTDTGAILGTVAYMSPEQARGLAVTKQADIWAFGCVLYEMLAARPVFSGESAPDIFVAILERTPDWTALPPGTPGGIRRLLRRCLEKDTRRRLRDIGDAELEIEEALVHPIEPASRQRTTRTTDVRFSRLTDFVGHKESPAISPDGKMVAFVAMADGRRQIWVRMRAGGAALQITRDATDHEQPRWSPDSSALIYFTRPRTGSSEGSIWQISALGGPARRVVSAQGSGGDISRDGQRVALFQNGADTIDLVTVSRDGSQRTVVARLPPENFYRAPRWAPDDRSIVFQVGSIEAFELRLEVIGIEDGQRREIARGSNLQGVTWRRDASGVVYSSSKGSTLLYPPVFNLRTVERDGSNDRQLTFGDISYVEPDMQASGILVACRSRSQSDIWRFPVSGTPAHNTEAGVRITHQSGHIQTPSVSPDESEVVYLSDNGGHANLWVAGTDGSNARQITFDDEPDVAIGVPYWSPTGEWIVFIVSRAYRSGLAVIRPDGSDRHSIGPPRAWHASWSSDGQWVYYSTPSESGFRNEKSPIGGGPAVIVRENVTGGIIMFNERAKYVFNRLTSPQLFGSWSGESEIVSVNDDGTMQSLVRIPGARVPVLPLLFAPLLSPSGEWLAIPLLDGATTNLWGLPASGGLLRPLTDFGNRSILIARSVSWALDSQSIYAAVAEIEVDVVEFDGLID